MTQQVKDLVLSLLRLRSLLWCVFDPWPWNLCMLWMWPEKECRYSYIHLNRYTSREFPSWLSGKESN